MGQSVSTTRTHYVNVKIEKSKDVLIMLAGKKTRNIKLEGQKLFYGG